MLCLLLARLARSTGATVIVTHHFRKQSVIKSSAEAREAIRGTTALVDGMRGVYALWYADEKTSRQVCDEMAYDYTPNMVVCGAVVKANFPADFSVHTYVRETTGLLAYIPEGHAVRDRRQERYRQLLIGGIDNAFKNGKPFTKSGRRGVYENRHELPFELRNVGKGRLQRMAQELLDDGRIIQTTHGDDKRAHWLSSVNADTLE